MVQVVCQPLTHELCASKDCRMCSPAYLRHEITELGAQFYPQEVKFGYPFSRRQLNSQINRKEEEEEGEEEGKGKRRKRRRLPNAVATLRKGSKIALYSILGVLK